MFSCPPLPYCCRYQHACSLSRASHTGPFRSSALLHGFLILHKQEVTPRGQLPLQDGTEPHSSISGIFQTLGVGAGVSTALFKEIHAAAMMLCSFRIVPSNNCILHGKNRPFVPPPTASCLPLQLRGNRLTARQVLAQPHSHGWFGPRRQSDGELTLLSQGHLLPEGTCPWQKGRMGSCGAEGCNMLLLGLKAPV